MNIKAADCYNKIRKGFILYGFLVICMATGCSFSDETSIQSTEEVTTYEEVRPNGKTINCTYNECIQTAFFEFSVSEPKYETYLTINDELYEIHDGYTFAICDVSITNTGDETITIFLDDFRVTWKDDVSDYGYGYSTMQDDTYMKDEFDIQPGESIEKKIMFKVPKDPEVTLFYEECYADDFIGNRYTIPLQP